MSSNLTVDELFPSKWLKVGDIDEEQDLALTITRYSIEEIGPDKERKPVLYFSETDKGLVLNKTNAETIGSLYGKGLPGWVGKRIALFTTEVTFGGKPRLGIRVRLRPPQAVKKQPAPQMAVESYPDEDL